MLEIVSSNAVIALLIAATAWVGSRVFHRPSLWRPSLWHAVWVLALVRLFLPPIFLTPVFSVPGGLTQPVIRDAQAIAPDVITNDATQSQNVPSALAIESSAAATATLPTSPPRVGFADVDWTRITMSIWLVGSVAVLLVSGYRILRFHRVVRRSSPVDADTTELLGEIRAMIGGRARMPVVRFVTGVVPPLLWPIGKTPVIVLPSLWWQTISTPQRRTVLLHEWVHWQRGDHWVRVLQWITSIVFWWHPVVWIARRELHRLEEQCCDAEVMHRLPDAGRAYASALLSASQWISDHVDARLPKYQSPPLALPMSDLDLFESFHRRIEMLPQLTYRPWTRRMTMAMILSALIPLSIGVGVSAQDDPVETKNTNATLVGRVTDTDGKPLADAKVRVVVPTGNLRFSIDPSVHREFFAQTDTDGKYSVEVSGIDSESTASVDILHPGHRRLVGTLMSGGDPNEVTLSPGKQSEFDAKLPASLYFAGRVADEAGKPIEGVSVGSNLRSGTGSSGVERTSTDADGRFAVYSLQAKHISGDEPFGETTVSIGFADDRYISTYLENLEDLDVDKRDQLKMELRSGYSIAGIVKDADAAAVQAVVVSIDQPKSQRKAVRTDADGRFRIDGLESGASKLRAVDAVGKQKLIEELDIDANDLDKTITLKSFDAPIAKTYSVLGMTLADITESLDDAYDLGTNKNNGVLILDPGTRADEFEIGELRPGYLFWLVGNEKIVDTQKFVQQLVKEATPPIDPDGNQSAWIENDGDAKVRVVYTYNNEKAHGTNTQYIRLTPQDVAELEQLLKTMPSD